METGAAAAAGEVILWPGAVDLHEHELERIGLEICFPLWKTFGRNVFSF
jgi:hypothetical protein